MTDRLQTSLRLKAARHLAGRLGEKGKRGQRAIPLPVGELADHELLRQNGVTANRLEEIEQMKTDARPMELEKIALALDLSPEWFQADVVPPLAQTELAERLAALEELLRPTEPAGPAEVLEGEADRLDAQRGRSGEGSPRRRARDSES